MMNRRELLGSAGALSLFPGLAMGTGSPDARGFEAVLRLAAAQSGAGNHRWARILDGRMTGDGFVGLVRSGRLDWHVDPASGAMEAELRCQLHCVDGEVRELRQRGLRATRAGQGMVRVTPFLLA